MGFLCRRGTTPILRGFYIRVKKMYDELVDFRKPIEDSFTGDKIELKSSCT